MHHLRLVPVEFGASDGHEPAHFLKHALAQIFVHALDLQLVGTLEPVYLAADAGAVRCGQCTRCKGLAEVELDISHLEVVVVHFDGAAQHLRLRVHRPLGLPLAAPVGVEVKIDAADVNLEVAV